MTLRLIHPDKPRKRLLSVGKRLLSVHRLPRKGPRGGAEAGELRFMMLAVA